MCINKAQFSENKSQLQLYSYNIIRHKNDSSWLYFLDFFAAGCADEKLPFEEICVF